MHERLTVPLIATPRDGDADRPSVRTCHVDDSLAQVRTDNINPAFDYLPVEEGTRNIVGVYHAKGYVNATEGDEQAPVRDHMCPLSEADLVGATQRSAIASPE